ncbi:MAG: glycosyltransferase [Betaproteobacteria bacterium]|nr:glycosyltransferase [Betaproteobacteria bacterium]
MISSRVLQVITGLGAGGAERLVLDLMAVFDKSRFEVGLVSIASDLSGMKVFGHADLPVEVFDLGAALPFKEFSGLARYIDHFRPEVVHAHMFHSLVATLVARSLCSTRFAVCFTSHNARHTRGRSLALWATRRLRDMDIVFDANQHLALNAARTVVIGNGIVVGDPPARTPWSSATGIRLLSVGRLAEQKDPLGLIRVFERARLDNATLEFVGAGPLEGAARALARQLGLGEQVRFSGVCNDVRERMRAADVLVMHSRYEGMPMAVLEAGETAMPVLATPVGTIPTLLREGRGFLARPDEFCSTLRHVALNPFDAIEAGRRLREHVVKHHSIEKTARRHESAYLELISSK